MKILCDIQLLSTSAFECLEKAIYFYHLPMNIKYKYKARCESHKLYDWAQGTRLDITCDEYIVGKIMEL